MSECPHRSALNTYCAPVLEVRSLKRAWIKRCRMAPSDFIAAYRHRQPPPGVDPRYQPPRVVASSASVLHVGAVGAVDATASAQHEQGMSTTLKIPRARSSPPNGAGPGDSPKSVLASALIQRLCPMILRPLALLRYTKPAERPYSPPWVTLTRDRVRFGLPVVNAPTTQDLRMPRPSVGNAPPARGHKLFPRRRARSCVGAP